MNSLDSLGGSLSSDDRVVLANELNAVGKALLEWVSRGNPARVNSTSTLKICFKDAKTRHSTGCLLDYRRLSGTWQTSTAEDAAHPYPACFWGSSRPACAG